MAGSPCGSRTRRSSCPARSRRAVARAASRSPSRTAGGDEFQRVLPPEEWVEPEDISDVVLFLASDESRYLTAHELAPDAGVTEF
ncbi:SDR family oxidoreductase [Amycolatopsis acidicola]|uniref:SDR family oxidoreductase n=1 Tax=Amycolatopsis acidicola TaxID=2596893 RepID=UPI001FB5C883|nr:SDR family oxidoreductase [Amycolatopsis acidicola]